MANVQPQVIGRFFHQAHRSLWEHGVDCNQQHRMPSREELERQVAPRTGRRVRNLAIELSSERIVLRGHADTYYIKQLAQHGVRDVLPQVRLDNDIIVGG